MLFCVQPVGALIPPLFFLFVGQGPRSSDVAAGAVAESSCVDQEYSHLAVRLLGGKIDTQVKKNEEDISLQLPFWLKS